MNKRTVGDIRIAVIRLANREDDMLALNPHEERKAFEAAVTTVVTNDNMRRAIIAYLADDMDGDEAARIYGVNPETMRVRSFDMANRMAKNPEALGILVDGCDIYAAKKAYADRHKDIVNRCRWASVMLQSAIDRNPGYVADLEAPDKIIPRNDEVCLEANLRWVQELLNQIGVSADIQAMFRLYYNGGIPMTVVAEKAGMTRVQFNIKLTSAERRIAAAYARRCGIDNEPKPGEIRAYHEAHRAKR